MYVYELVEAKNASQLLFIIGDKNSHEIVVTPTSLHDASPVKSLVSNACLIVNHGTPSIFTPPLVGVCLN